MGLLFNKIIPFDILVQMPRPFVHRLRDIRIKQLEEANKQQAQHMQMINNSSNKGNTKKPPFPPNFNNAMFDETAIDDIIDELT